MWTWGSVFHEVPGMEPWGSFLGGWINHNHILKNLPIMLSFFGFYLLPILMIEFLNSGFKDFFYRYFKSFFFALIILIFFITNKFIKLFRRLYASWGRGFKS